MSQWEIRQGDCLALLREMPDNSADLILTDPPYFRVKGEWWDRQWDNSAAFLAWLDTLTAEWQRVLRPNGSLYVFASPKMAARVEVTLGERFNVLNRIRWVKQAGWHNKTDTDTLRSYLSPWEEIIFAEHHGADNIAKGEAGYEAQCDRLRGFVFEPLRAYLDGERRRAGLGSDAIQDGMHRLTGKRYMFARHSFSRSQFCLPTIEQYEGARCLFNEIGRRPAPPFAEYHPANSPYRFAHAQGDEYLRADYEHLRADYEHLRADYEYLRADYEHLRADYEHLRRPFCVTREVPYTDVWDFPTVQAYPGKHPCEKPQALLRHIITASSRPDALVLDCFAGTGSTGVAALALGRRFLGIEIDERYCATARRRLAEVQPPLPTSDAAAAD